MKTKKFMQSIGLPERAMVAAERVALSEEEIAALPKMPVLDESYKGDRPDYVLALFVDYLAKYSEEAYEKRGISREEWLQTMGDLTLWCNQLYVETGETGLRETAWLAHLVRTEIFRLGRLQFVPQILSEELRVGGTVFPAGTKYAEVHVPAGEKLSPEAAELSFARAKEIFAPRFFTCESWLLSPKLKDYLRGGNILAFASRFRILSVSEADRSAERYLFGKIADPQEYSPQNGFSVWVKKQAESGNFVGSAYGILMV